jgi:hypothetical protein
MHPNFLWTAWNVVPVENHVPKHHDWAISSDKRVPQNFGKEVVAQVPSHVKYVLVYKSQQLLYYSRSHFHQRLCDAPTDISAWMSVLIIITHIVQWINGFDKKQVEPIKKKLLLDTRADARKALGQEMVQSPIGLRTSAWDLFKWQKVDAIFTYDLCPRS